MLIRDRLGNWTYQFAVTVDDWRQGVDLVIRGIDLLQSTGRQIQLARLLGRDVPPIYMHHPLIMKSADQKLSKSDGDTGIRALRAAGWTREQVSRRIEPRDRWQLRGLRPAELKSACGLPSRVLDLAPRLQASAGAPRHRPSIEPAVSRPRTEEDDLKLEGVYSVLPTPFLDNGDVDEASLRRVVDLFIDAGVNGVTALGVTGEVARLDEPSGAGARGRRRPGQGTHRRRRRHDRRRHADVHQLQPPGQGGRRDGRHGQPAAHAEAQFRRGGAALRGARRRGGHRDRRAGLSADLRLRDGAGAAGAHRQGHPARAHDQARGSADAVQDVADSRTGGRHGPRASSAVWAACSCSKS